jgi:DNA-binding transcriptional ArsR family regulator
LDVARRHPQEVEPMSITIMAQLYATKLGNATLKAVALKLADYANDDGGSIFPALETVALHTEVSKSTVQRSVRALLEMGVLTIEREGGKGPGSTTRYRFDLARLSAAPKVVNLTTFKVVNVTTSEAAKVVTDAGKDSHPDHIPTKEPSNEKVSCCRFHGHLV